MNLEELKAALAREQKAISNKHLKKIMGVKIQSKIDSLKKQISDIENLNSKTASNKKENSEKKFEKEIKECIECFEEMIEIGGSKKQLKEWNELITTYRKTLFEFKEYKKMNHKNLFDELCDNEDKLSKSTLQNLISKKIEILNGIINKQIIIENNIIEELEASIKKIKEKSVHKEIVAKLIDCLFSLIYKNQRNINKALFLDIKKVIKSIGLGKKIKAYIEIEEYDVGSIYIDSNGINICGEDEWGEKFDTQFSWNGEINNEFVDDENEIEIGDNVSYRNSKSYYYEQGNKIINSLFLGGYKRFIDNDVHIDYN